MSSFPGNADPVNQGVLLLNLGGPETLADVHPFLFHLFSDPEIIRIKNDRLRRVIARFIAATRQRKSRALYRQIGGGSPLRRITSAQATALSARLKALNCAADVYVGMLCWNPTIAEAADKIMADHVNRLLVLPLFPQYSLTTSGACIRHFQAVAERTGLNARARVFFVESWFDEPLYIDAMADTIRDAVRQIGAKSEREVHLLYSAHSIPARYLEEGDPYLSQIQRTVGLINKSLGEAYPSTLAFQSKVGPVKWLEPATKNALRILGQQGARKVVVVPVGFVSDHIETLQEIDIHYRQLARASGIAEFRRAASLNLYPKFIEALAEISLRVLCRRV